jgi:potassium-transporting ATPase potassium-binding subunit
MSLRGWAEIAIVAVVIGLLIKPIGSYIYHVFEGEHTFLDPVLGPIERFLFRFLSVDKDKEYKWTGYILRLLILDFAFIFFAYLIFRLQGHLPLNPAQAPGMRPDLAFNSAVSFGTNTNWQAYAGETQASNLTQMIALTTCMFTSVASGIVFAIAFMRGLSRRANPFLGNFYADFIRAVLRILLPLALLFTLILIPLGVPQTLKGPVQTQTLEGGQQEIARGPVATLESIKHIGNNGGGFFNANSAHPFENPSPVTNIIEILMMFLIPASMVYVLGLYLRNRRQGWVIFVAIILLFIIFAGLTMWFEARPRTGLNETGVDMTAGNMEGKETRYGVDDSALFGASTTAATTGSVNSSHDSYTALGGMMLGGNMMLNAIFGSCGAGLINILIYIIFTVFIAGLMVGRTPEFSGKKIEGREVKLGVIALLIHPLCILAFTTLSLALPSARNAILNSGPHGITEMAYAFTSATANNGSAFGGLAANTAYFNVTIGLAMLIGRYAIFIPMLAVAGSLAEKQIVPESEGTFRTDSPLFAGLLIGVILIIGALTFFPVLALGPLAEHFTLFG